MIESEKPRILVTGAAGQLGMEFQRIAPQFPEFDFHFTSRIDLDVTLESRVHAHIQKTAPDAVINCAAYTNVERAEDDRENADLVNAMASRFLASACAESNALLVHFSTDYVFDGKSAIPYTETDEVNPLNHYGMSKLQGEREIDEILDRHIILRTSWLYNIYGHNFYKTMLRLAKEHGKLRVVSDQKASPTFAGSLATDVMRILQRGIMKREHLEYGLYHYSEDGEASWFEFAQAIVKQHGMDIPVQPVSTEEYPTRAVRPVYSKLKNDLFKSTFNLPHRTWQQGLQQCIESEY
jgi:dTDP-4-dehydrorhamnose reductase